MSDEVREIWPCIRVSREGMATLGELCAWDGLSIDDVDLANIALDAVEDAVIRSRKRRS